MTGTTSANFKQIINGAASGEIVVPALRAALWSPDFKSFDVKVAGFEPRPPDGWFHPSTHPLWPERLLYWYLVAPDRLEMEPFDPASTMAVTQGHFWHSLIGVIGMELGIFTAVEVPVKDEHTGSRGSMDATLANEVFEFKTMRPTKYRKIERGAPDDPLVIAAWRKMVPDYYAQAQEYMRLSGYRRHRTLVLSMEYPFPMREIVIDFDPVFAYEIAQKFVRVRQAVADGRPPFECCATKDCPSRLLCPAGVS